MTSAPQPSAPESLRLARRPLAAPTAVPVAVVLALLVGAAGVVCGRDALIGWRLVGGTAWIPRALDAVLRVRADSAWLAPTAIAAVTAGLALLVLALAPRRRTHDPLTSDGVWLRRRDVSTLISDAGNLVPGVDAVRVRGSGRRRSVTITPNLTAAADPSGVKGQAHSAFGAALAPLAKPPNVKVRMQKGSRR